MRLRGNLLDLRINISGKMFENDYVKGRKFRQFCRFGWNSKIIPAKAWKATNLSRKNVDLSELQKALLEILKANK